MNTTYEQHLEQTIKELIYVLDKAAMVFAQYEIHHAEKGAIDKSIANGKYKKMCLNAINKTKGADLINE